MERTVHAVLQIQFPENNLFKCNKKILLYIFLLYTIQRFSMKPRAKMRCPWFLLSPPFSSLALSAVAQDKGGRRRDGGFFFFAKEKGGKESSLAFLPPLGGGERRREGKRPCKKKRKGGARGGASPPTESQLASSVGRKARAQRHTPFFLRLSLSLLFTQLG